MACERTLNAAAVSVPLVLYVCVLKCYLATNLAKILNICCVEVFVTCNIILKSCEDIL